MLFSRGQQNLKLERWVCAERPDELARPYLHEFLTAVYEHYDLVIWSATNMKWIEVKMRELGVSTNPAYRLTAFMDHKSMVTIHTAKYGEPQLFE